MIIKREIGGRRIAIELTDAEIREAQRIELPPVELHPYRLTVRESYEAEVIIYAEDKESAEMRFFAWWADPDNMDTVNQKLSDGFRGVEVVKKSIARMDEDAVDGYAKAYDAIVIRPT